MSEFEKSFKVETLRTNNTFEAAYILLQGFELKDQEKEDGRTYFIFKGKEIRQASKDYFNNVGGFKRVIDAFRYLKRMALNNKEMPKWKMGREN